MRPLKFAGAVCACLLAITWAAVAEDGMHQVNRVSFVAPIRVASVLLPAGDYEVVHTMEGTDHVMVFRAANHKHPDVKAKCVLVQLGNKADQTRTVYDVNSANERVLRELVFGGDAVKHVFF